MAMGDHIRLVCLVDGVRQVKVSNIQVNGESGAQAVETLEGLVGKTPGASSVEITANWALPVTGQEFNVVDAAKKGTYHEIQIPLGNKTLISQGWWQNFGISGSTGANTEVTGTFKGEMSELQ